MPTADCASIEIHPSLPIDNTSNIGRRELTLYMSPPSLSFHYLSYILQYFLEDEIPFTFKKLGILILSISRPSSLSIRL